MDKMVAELWKSGGAFRPAAYFVTRIINARRLIFKKYKRTGFLDTLNISTGASLPDRKLGYLVGLPILAVKVSVPVIDGVSNQKAHWQSAYHIVKYHPEWSKDVKVVLITQ